MKVIQFIGHGMDPVISDVSAPVQKSENAIVEVSHAALNHRDLWILKGQYSKIQYPLIPGSDLCGYIDNRRVVVNPGYYWGENEKVQAKDFQILGLPQNGSLSELVSVPHEYIYDAPMHLKDSEAAALPLVGITAYRALFTKCKAIKGESLLITGIGGGVALQVMQFAIAHGVHVYVSSSSDEKIYRAISLGAKGGINYTNENWDKELLSKIAGVDMVIDSSGGTAFSKLTKVCLPAARICLYGGTQGAITELSPQVIYWKQLSIFGTTMGTQTEFREMIDFVTKNNITPVVDSVYEMENIKDAFTRMDDKKQFGKIVIKIKQ